MQRSKEPCMAVFSGSIWLCILIRQLPPDWRMVFWWQVQTIHPSDLWKIDTPDSLLKLINRYHGFLFVIYFQGQSAITIWLIDGLWVISKQLFGTSQKFTQHTHYHKILLTLVICILQYFDKKHFVKVLYSETCALWNLYFTVFWQKNIFC